MPDLAVIAYSEIPSDLMIDPVMMLRVDDVMSTIAAGAATDTSSRDAGAPATDVEQELRSALAAA